MCQTVQGHTVRSVSDTKQERMALSNHTAVSCEQLLTTMSLTATDGNWLHHKKMLIAKAGARLFKVVIAPQDKHHGVVAEPVRLAAMLRRQAGYWYCKERSELLNRLTWLSSSRGLNVQ